MISTYEVIKTLKEDELYLVSNIDTDKIYRYRVVKNSDPYIFMTLKTLKNKNRINIIDVLQEDDYIAVVEEVLTGESLFEIISSRGHFL